MANICEMKMVFFSEKNQKGLEELHLMLVKALQEHEGRFTSVLDEKVYSGVSMRGYFTHISELEPDRFSAGAETAWSPQYDYLETLCSVYGVEFASSSDEPDSNTFEIYGDMEGDYFTHTFSIDIWGNDGTKEEEAPVIKASNEFFDTEQEMLDWLNSEEHYGTLFQADSWEDWELFFDRYEAGHIRCWTRIS